MNFYLPFFSHKIARFYISKNNLSTKKSHQAKCQKRTHIMRPYNILIPISRNRLMDVCPLRYGLFLKNFLTKKSQSKLPKNWWVDWLYGIILFIFSNILYKIMIWGKIKEIKRSTICRSWVPFLWTSERKICTVPSPVNVFSMWSARFISWSYILIYKNVITQ